MSKSTEKLVLGGGCFWCLDASYRLVKGVIDVTSGYAGGHVTNPSYEQVAMQNTGHAEVIQIEYDSSAMSLKDLMNVFWVIHDPTTLNRQGNDMGPEYRSIVFYKGDNEKKVIEKSRDEAKKVWGDKIVTEIVPLDKFYPADESHQDFFNKNPDTAYCQVIINPKLTKLRQKLSGLLET